MTTVFEQRRDFVYAEFSKIISKKTLSNKQKSTLMKKLWKVAKRRFKD